MCGIVGYVGHQQAAPILLEGLKKLEYRGYDSAGIVAMEEQQLKVVKKEGKLSSLAEALNGETPEGSIGIGHTRWATHGKPSDSNAHPHLDCQGQIAVVHNGIIENFQPLKEWLLEQGHSFRSETDTEVLPHLVEQFYQGDLLAAVQQAVARLEGSYAMAVLCAKDPEKIVAVRKDVPLIIGLGQGETFLASDIPALLNHTRNALILEDHEVAVLTAADATVYDQNGQQVTRKPFYVQWDLQAAEKAGYPHFMLKEIHEQPRALRDTIGGRLKEDGTVLLPEVRLTLAQIRSLQKVAVVACGTAAHAGIVGKYIMEKLVRMPVEVDIASEFRYRDPLVDENTLTVIISQSGETADTLAGLRAAKQRGSRVVAVTNVVGSSIAREAHDVIYTMAGPEIAVASTKAYITQLEAMYLLAGFLGQARGTIAPEAAVELAKALQSLPQQVHDVLAQESTIKKWAERISQWDDAFFIGRGLDYAVALEGSLKLKEISYIHAEAYAAGELKHGTLALITEGVPVIALATQPDLYDKMVSNITEVKARGAYVTALTLPGSKEIAKAVDEVFYLPEANPLITPVLTVVPLQLLAYYAAICRDCDVDKPRNLAKSVTVE
ncbi:MAG: glutamine--fructose-6-phosphate transaminase (isomerizing) [Syntrophomonadaceae bacterium]|nr:glutamine--fructose-6-phosphate transaminase (isomerizing) [Syntrophomonadaceae bacterium]